MTLERFQMDPCGVEARGRSPWKSIGASFRWTLVGSKLLEAEAPRADLLVSDGPLWGRSISRVFIQTQLQRVSDGPLWGRSYPRAVEEQHGRVFQMDPCGVEAYSSRIARTASLRVSDGPLWGRSEDAGAFPHAVENSFRWTLVGSKQS